jgi:prepilin signal peptidase PulO-like enzyme (type II secretory pathway)
VTVGIASTCLVALYGLTLIFLSTPAIWQVLGTLVLVIPLIWLSLTDLRSNTIPDLASAWIASYGLLSLLSTSPEAFWITGVVALFLLLVLGGVSQIYWNRTGREALGLGDVKLIAAGTLVVGAQALWLMLLLASIGGIVAALLSPRSRATGIPFGPFLAYSIFVTFLTGNP